MKKPLESKKIEFLNYLSKHKGYSDLTLKTYDSALLEALQFIEVEQEDTFLRFNLMPYRLHIASNSAKTIAKKLSAVRSFIRFLDQNGIRTVLVADESIKTPKTLPKPISHTHIEEALKYATLMERFIIVMIYTLGLRISELHNITLEEISQEWIRIHGKGNKERDVPLLPQTRALIKNFLDEYKPKRYLFERNGERLSQNSLRYLIDKAFKRVGLKVTPHQLRHSFATALLNNGAPIADVSELLGHASMATTQIYTKLGSALKKENYEKTHPLCNGEL